jgi:hypothetical protein
MFTQTPFPYTPVPEEMILRLIKEELRGRKLFHKLSSLGITENNYYPSFSWLVLNTLGLNAEDDVMCERYFEILDEHVGKLRANSRGDGDIKEAGEVLKKLRNLRSGEK